MAWAPPVNINDEGKRGNASRNLVQIAIADDGHPVATWVEGGMEQFGATTNQVYVQRINGFITVIFHCPAGYPNVPPRVQVRTPSNGGWQASTPNAVRAWNANSMLVEIVREIDDTTP